MHIDIISDQEYASRTVRENNLEQIPEWILKHDESLARFPQIVKLAKVIKRELHESRGMPYIRVIHAVDLVLDDVNAAEMDWVRRRLNIRTADSIARVAAFQTVIHGSRTQNTLFDVTQQWQLILHVALSIELGRSRADSLCWTWVEAARRSLRNKRASANQHDYRCFDSQHSATANTSSQPHSFAQRACRA